MTPCETRIRQEFEALPLGFAARQLVQQRRYDLALRRFEADRMSSPPWLTAGGILVSIALGAVIIAEIALEPTYLLTFAGMLVMAGLFHLGIRCSGLAEGQVNPRRKLLRELVDIHRKEQLVAEQSSRSRTADSGAKQSIAC